MKLTDDIKKQIVTKLKPLNPLKIIIFGSYAYGNPTKDSDLDICVVEKNYKNRFQEKQKIRELLKDIDLPKDILNKSYNALKHAMRNKQFISIIRT